jgi:hypothetical protein
MVTGKLIETDVETDGLFKRNILEFMRINWKAKESYINTSDIQPKV